MIPEENSILFFKFGEQRWMDVIKNGELSFSCIGAFIQQAKNTGNIIQGDLYEGVFARVLKEDERIERYKKLLGRDLEMIDQGDHVLLRRKSSKFVPIFCIYSFKAKDVTNENVITRVGKQNLKHEFDERMYTGFANTLNISNVLNADRIFTQLTIDADAFVKRIKIASVVNNIPIESHNVNYELFKKDEFWIEPTEKYEELFHKFPDYGYQHEARIAIPSMKLKSIYDRKTFTIVPFKDDEIHETHVPLYMEFMADIVSY